jgi:hypothetical protein
MKDTTITRIRKKLSELAEDISPEFGCLTVDAEVNTCEGEVAYIKGTLYGEFQEHGANVIDGDTELAEGYDLQDWEFDGKAFLTDEDGNHLKYFDIDEINGQL